MPDIAFGVGDKAFVLRLLPSGIIHEDKTCVLGNGMVIDPKAFFEEVDQITEKAFRFHLTDLRSLRGRT